MIKEPSPENIILLNYLYKEFSINPYAESKRDVSIIEASRPELVNEYCISSLGYIISELISKIEWYQSTDQSRRIEAAESLTAYFAHKISRAVVYTNELRNENEQLVELGNVFRKLYDAHGKIGTAGEPDLSEILSRIKIIQAELNLKPSDRFILGEKLGIKREDMILIFAERRLEFLSGYIMSKQKYVSELYGTNEKTLISKEDVEARQLVEGVLNPNLDKKMRIKKLVVLSKIMSELVIDRSFDSQDFEQVQEINFLVSQIVEIIEK